MYAQFWNQLYHILHYLFAFVLLLVLYPRLLFTRISSDSLEQLAANFMRMVFLLIIMGYLLVVTKLFEFLSITAILAILVIYKYSMQVALEKREETQSRIITRIYDYFEGLIQLKHVLLKWLEERKQSAVEDVRTIFSSVSKMTTVGLILVVFIISVYIRFYDAVHSPVPGLSDGNVTLSWMKSIDARVLFADGFYPQGLYIVMDTIFKFANIDPIYVLKYTGPLNIILVEIGFFLVVSRFSGNTFAGIFACIVYGILSPLFAGATLFRQAATNSQEFAFLFVIPSLYFYIKYLKGGKKDFLIIAGAGTAVVGLVHEVAFVWLGLGMGILLILHILLEWKHHLKRVLWTSAAGVAAVIITVLPLLLSMVLGVQQHGSSSTFLTSVVLDSESPLLNVMDYLALAAIGVLLIYALLKKGSRSDKLPELLVAFLTGFTFLIYYYGRPLTHNEVISTRALDVWVLCIPLSLGMAWHAIFQVIARVKIKFAIELLLGFGVLSVALYIVPPKPIIPYKMEYDTAVEQYLQISKKYRSMQFMIVSPRVQEYAIVLGKGNHMYLGEGSPSLLNEFDPQKPLLTKKGEDEPIKVAPDIFVFYEKKIFKISEDLDIYHLEEPKYMRYEKEYADLQTWIEAYKEAHKSDNSFSIFYEDDNFIVYHLHRDADKNEQINKIWS